ncbi:unnamed protein product [Spirodela intermedia]|uniref:Uncharacterized protein n=1 Tax=Spirodela intermedia TaxID=51605 RepID=A0A7I8KRX0_SPIIN|nr:unnamed protein product [Spirodela intermedia]
MDFSDDPFFADIQWRILRLIADDDDGEEPSAAGEKRSAATATATEQKGRRRRGVSPPARLIGPAPPSKREGTGVFIPGRSVPPPWNR